MFLILKSGGLINPPLPVWNLSTKPGVKI